MHSLSSPGIGHREREGQTDESIPGSSSDAQQQLVLKTLARAGKRRCAETLSQGA